jgi:hypothetical protein
MQTWTRATTMESANESARHAVNSLLAHYSRRTDIDSVPELRHTEACPIWNPEEYEHPDLRFWQELDERLFDWDGERLPHMLDILDLDTLADELLESDGFSKIVDQLTRLAPGGKTFR